MLVCFEIITGCASLELYNHGCEKAKFNNNAYLSKQELPDSITLLPPPPADYSMAMVLDEEIRKESLALRYTPRWKQAINDAQLDLDQPQNAAETFSCALGVSINKKNTKKLFELLEKIRNDAGNSTNGAKEKYCRPRPFMATEDKDICTTGEKDPLIKNGSYPSGHTAIGWAWALVLAEISPDQTNAILARGLAFGESRIVCNVHWQSDVIGGRVMGSAVIDRLHANSAFLKDVKDAKQELEDFRNTPEGRLKPPNCEAETATLFH